MCSELWIRVMYVCSLLHVEYTSNRRSTICCWVAPVAWTVLGVDLKRPSAKRNKREVQAM